LDTTKPLPLTSSADPVNIASPTIEFQASQLRLPFRFIPPLSPLGIAMLFDWLMFIRSVLDQQAFRKLTYRCKLSHVM
jgi:hypothetical protein